MADISFQHDLDRDSGRRSASVLLIIGLIPSLARAQNG
jgi:hypothetical protein